MYLFTSVVVPFKLHTIGIKVRVEHSPGVSQGLLDRYCGRMRATKDAPGDL